MNVTMTGGKRKVRQMSRCPITLDRNGASVVACIELGNGLRCAKNENSLTCLAADEPEPYCLDDVEKVWWKSWEGGRLCSSMIGAKEWRNFSRRLCSLVA